MAEREIRSKESGTSHEDFLLAAKSFQATHPENPQSTVLFARRATRALERIEGKTLFDYTTNRRLREKDTFQIPEGLLDKKAALLYFLASMWGTHIGYLTTKGDPAIEDRIAMARELGLSVEQARSVCMQMQEQGDLEHLNTVFLGPAFRIGGMDLLTEDEKK